MTTTATKVIARAKAFSNEGAKRHIFQVEPNGEVLVWDSVAGHYTTCHALSKAAMKRIREIAQSSE